MRIGEVIRKLRKEKNLTSSELAKRAGISQAYLSQLETGKNNNPTSDILKKIALGLNIPYMDLWFIAESDEVPEADTLFLPSNLKKDEQTIPVTLFLPRYSKHIKNEDYFIEISPDEWRRKIFDLYELLNENINLYYKGEILSNDKRDKIKIMLKTILE